MSAHVRGRGQGARVLLCAVCCVLSAVCCVLCAVCSVLCAAVDAQAETANRIVAVVDDEIITESDVAAQTAELLEEFAKAIPDDAKSTEVERVALQRLIEQRVMLQEAKRLKLVVAPEEVEHRMRVLRERFESEEAYRAFLTESNLTDGALREHVRNRLMVQALVDAKVRSTVTVSPQEVAGVLSAQPELAKGKERVRALHLLVRIDEQRSEEAARERIEDFHRRLLAGEEFATLAKRHSEDSQEGVIDWVARGELLPELDRALFSLNTGETSAPIRTTVGFHLIKVEERGTAEGLSLMEANQTVYQQLYQQKFTQAFRQWIQGLKRRAYIEILDAS